MHQCIRPLVGALLRAIMGISARAISLADRLQPSHLGYQCSHTPGRPILHRRLKSSRRPRQARKWLHHRDSSPSLEQFLCSRLTPFLRPDLCVDNGAARRDGQGWPSLGLAYPASALPGHALTGPSTGRRHLSAAGRLIGLLAFEVAVITENGPGDPGELVSERNGEHVGMQSPLRSCNPLLEPVTLPDLGLD